MRWSTSHLTMMVNKTTTVMGVKVWGETVFGRSKKNHLSMSEQNLGCTKAEAISQKPMPQTIKMSYLSVMTLWKNPLSKHQCFSTGNVAPLGLLSTLLFPCHCSLDGCAMPHHLYGQAFKSSSACLPLNPTLDLSYHIKWVFKMHL